MDARIVGLTRYTKKGEPGEALSAIMLLEGLGAEGDFHRGEEKQISILAVETHHWMEAQSEKGLCFGRFRENILTEGLPLETLKSGCHLSMGSAVIRISGQRKECFSDCGRFSKGQPCRLFESAAFAQVEKSGIVRINDPVIILPPTF